MGFPSKIPMFDAMRVTKEVHSIVPIILKFVSHCLTIALAGETQILLTMVYNIINSSFRACALNEESDSECPCTKVQTFHEQLDPKSNLRTHVD